MSVLRNLEAKLEGLVGGAFSRAFKSRVQPVEIARKLAKEMHDNQTVSISRTYVPNHYTVYLSPQDRAQFEGYEDGVKKELSDYLLENARTEGLALITRPTIDFETDDGWRSASSASRRSWSADRTTRTWRPPSTPGRPRATSATRWSTRPTARRGRWRRRRRPGARCSWATASAPCCRAAALIGRSRDCDVTLEDPNASRRHAELRNEDGHWIVTDLGSTNGVKVNGRKVEQAVLQPGDELSFGLAQLRFELE